MSEEITALSLAYGLNDIYNEFTESVKALGGKYNAKGKKMGQSILHWVAGSHVRTERDVLCEKFYADVKAYLETFSIALEGLDKNEVEEACAVLTEILSTPVPVNSNSTTDLMKRAMVGQAKPFISMLSKEKLVNLKTKLESNYKKSQRLPVEKEIIKEIDKYL